LGIDIDKVIVGEIAHRSAGMTNAQAYSVFLEFTERARSVPGVTAAAAAIGHSFGLGWGMSLNRPGREQPKERNNPSHYAVTPEYFKVMGIRLLSGRSFTDADRAGSALVAIINETSAQTYWPGENPIGQCVKVGADTMPCATVIGIVANARRQRLIEGPVAQVYRPLDQIPAAVSDRTVSSFGYALLVRTERNPRALIEPLRRTLQATAPNVPYAQVRPLRDRLDRQTRTWTLGATMLTVFGALALVLSAIGLYSVVVFTIAQRLHEFGVRVALGASGANLVRLTVLRGVLPAAVGIVLGLGLALLGGRFVTELLYELSPRDPLVLGSAGAVLLLAATLASIVPAVRVTRVDPMLAMRSD
jgi:predicted permease